MQSRSAFGGGGASRWFGAGGPFSTASAAAKLTLAVVIASVVAQLFPAVMKQVLLYPGAVVGELKLWQLFTYTFLLPIQHGLFFIIGLIVLWSIGNAMESSWGARRFLSFAIGVTVVSAVLTTLVSLLWPSLRTFPYFGAQVLFSVVWVAYGVSIGAGRTNFWGLPMNGYGLALIGVAFVALEAIRARSVVPVVPEIFGLTLTWAYVRLGSPRVLILRFRHWKLQRELKSRSKHLNVVSGGRDGGRGSDRYIH